MRTFLRSLFFSVVLLAMWTPERLSAAAGDVYLTQRNQAGNANVQRTVTATANSIFAFDSNLLPTRWTLGANLTVSNGVLDAIGGGGGGGSGTVTSFSAGDLSPLFTTSEATATTTPALSFSLSNAAQNVVFAGPASGGAGAPSYRALVADDIPSLTLSKISDASANGRSLVAAADYAAMRALLSLDAINNTTIGATTPSTGAFTTLSASDAITMSDKGIRYLEGASWAESAGFLAGRGSILAQSGTLNPAVVLLSTTGAPSQAVYFGSAARGTLSALTPTQANDGQLFVFRSYGGSTWANSARIEMFASDTHSETSRPSYIAFHTTPVDSVTNTERMRIGPDGNVGIGTSSPVRKLSVSVSSNVTTPGTDGGSQALSLENTDATDQNTVALAFAGYDSGAERRTSGMITTKFSGRGVGQLSGALGFWTRDGTNLIAERMTLGPTGDLSLTGSIISGTWAGSVIAPQYLGTGTRDGTRFLRDDGVYTAIPGGGDALTENPLSQFASTTSLQLKNVLSDELGSASGKVIFAEGQLDITAAKTLTATNTLTLSGTDGSTLNVGTGGTLGSAAYQATSAFQAASANLTTFASIAPSSNVQSLLGAADYAAIRTQLSLGGAALLSVGTTAGTVAAGDDSRITGAVQTSRTISTTSPLSGGGDLSANRTIAISDAAADGTTKGAATFTASDFDATGGLISIDYTNAQAASGSNKGFLTSADWTTFNSKQAGSANLTTFAGIAPSANVQSFLAAADYAAMRTAMSVPSFAELVANNASGVNTDGLVHWTQLVGVPAGFADGTDDGAGGGSGTVTNTGGNLTNNAFVLGAGTVDTKVSTGINSDGTAQVILGVDATTAGSIKLFGGTSGNVTITPTAAAGTGTALTLPATTGTLALTSQLGMGGSYTVTGNTVASSGNVTITSGTNFDINLTPGGTGNVVISNATVTSNLSATSFSPTAFTGATANGQLFIGNVTNGNFAKAVPTGTNGITVTAGASSLSFDFIAPGTSGNVLTSNGTAWTSAAPSGGGNVTAASTFAADNRLVRSDGTSRGIQGSNIVIDDSDNVSGVANLSVTGTVTLEKNSVITRTATTANAIDVTRYNSQALTANVTATFTGTPVDEQWFDIIYSANGTAWTVTMPADCVNMNTSTTLTSVEVPANGYVHLTMRYDSTAAKYLVYGAPVASGAGTVTDFSAGDLSPLFTTTEATTTSTPALSFSLSNAAQNAVFAGPGSGGTGAPSYRALVSDDIPALAISKITNLQTTLDAKAVAADIVANNASGVNTDGLVHWTQLIGVPAGFADGTDDGAGGGSGTVTNTGGSLTNNLLVLGAGTVDTKVAAGIGSDGTSQIVLGVDATTAGSLKLFGGTSGNVTLTPTAAAGTGTALTLPATTGTLALTSQLTASGVGLSNVTNDAQTQAAIVPNTAPSAGQILAGNAGGTAYAPVTVSGDLTMASTGAATLATVNSNVGTYGSATAASVVTVNAKGLVTAASNVTVTPAIGSVTGLGTGIASALGVNTGSAGAPVLFDGAGGTPASLTLTNATGLPTAGMVDGAVTLAKMANLAQDQFIGRVTASTGVPETTTITAAARSVLDDATVGDMVNTLGGATSSGTGGLARVTGATLTTATLAGNTTISGTSIITTPAMNTAEIDVTKQVQTRALTTNETATLSATPGDETWFSVVYGADGSGPYTLTLPAGTYWDMANGASVTSFSVPASGYVHATFRYNSGNTTYYVYGLPVTAGSGDASTNTSTSVDSEIVLFSGTGGKTLKRATTTGVLKASSGVIAAAVSGTDYAPATSGTSILKGDGSGGFSNAASGTDYAPATSGSGVLKGNGSGGFSAAVADTDYVAPGGNIGAGTATTPSANDNDTSIATTGYVQTELTAYASDTVTLTNKRITSRTNSITSNATWAPDVSTTDLYIVTAQAEAATTISNPSGSPTEGQKLMMRIKDNGTARALTWSGSQWRASTDLALPTTTTLGKTLYLGFVYNSTDTKWDLVAKLDNF